jgi:predicted ATPase
MHFPDGVWIADLAPLSDPDLVPASVAVALGLTSLEMTAERIAGSVGTKHILLVLDNCEHVINASWLRPRRAPALPPPTYTRV